MRKYEFDNLRAILAISGIFFHASWFFASLPLLQPNVSHGSLNFFDIFCLFIHMFYMSLFFWLAGYFGAQMLVHKGIINFCKNRLKRIGVPLILGMFLLVPSNFVALFNIFRHENFHFNTDYLWFLYYLLIFYLCGIFFVVVNKCRVGLGEHTLFVLDGPPKMIQLMGHRARKACALLSPSYILYIALPGALAIYFSNSWYLLPDSSLIPNISLLICYGSALFIGWLTKSENGFLNIYQKNIKLNGILSIILFGFYCLIFSRYLHYNYHANILKFLDSFLYNLASWLLSFSLIGFFIKYLNKKSNLLLMISRASYWMYLSQIPILFLIRNYFQVIKNVYWQFLLLSLSCFFIQACTKLAINHFVSLFSNRTKIRV